MDIMVIPRDETEEETQESLVRFQGFRMMRRRFTNHWRSGILPRHSSSREACKQESNPKPLYHTVFKYFVLSLLLVVGVKYQAISEDPLKTRPLHSWSFLIAAFVYSMVPLAMKQSRNHCERYLQILGRVALASVVVSSLSLMSLLLPHLPGLIVLYTSWALFVIIISALPLLQRIYNGILKGITAVLNICICLARNFGRGWNFNEQPPPGGARAPV